MNRDVLIGIGTGVAICAAGIVYSPPLPLIPEVAALFGGILGGLAILTVVAPQYPAAVGCRTAGILLIGGFALATGILTGAAALGALALMAGAGILLGRTILRGWAPGQRLPVGDST